MAYSPPNKSDYSLRNGSGTMSLSGHSPLATKPPDDAVGDPQIPLINLSVLQNRMNSLQKFLSESLNSNTLLGQPQLDMVSSEIASAIRQTVLNGTALLSCSSSARPLSADEKKEEKDPGPPIEGTSGKAMIEMQLDDESDGYDIIELDAVELLAEHVHLCEICGKGFKRDANLRMHMRAHGNQFKTPEALAKPEKAGDPMGRRRTRFSCPYLGCNRNRQHKKFRPLKSAICVKNHFKRSHCPKMYSCNRCNKKSFSVVAALKSHMKHCGESKWRCACGTSFSRKDKLFGHMALFEGHVPAVMDEGEEEKGKALATAEMVVVDDDDEEEINARDLRCGLWTNNGFSEGLLDDGFNSIDDYCIPDVLSSPKFAHTFGLGVEGFLNF